MPSETPSIKPKNPTKTSIQTKNNETYDVDTDSIRYSDDQDAKGTYQAGKVAYG
jgi:hypothetical protein